MPSSAVASIAAFAVAAMRQAGEGSMRRSPSIRPRLEWALHAKIFGSEMAVDVINDLIRVVGMSAYDNNFPLVRYLNDALAYPVIEGSNVGVRRRQLQGLRRTDGYESLAASGMA